ncbi:hypothetical protein V6Z11_D05G312300 [Gossypium hirsutum]
MEGLLQAGSSYFYYKLMVGINIFIFEFGMKCKFTGFSYF